jgi:hypothetical protein
MTYKVELTIVLDDSNGSFSDSEVDEIFTNLDIDSSIATISATSVNNYSLVMD